MSSPCPRATQANVSRARCQTSWWSTSAEAPLQLGLRGQELLPLALEGVVVREVELHGQDPDIAGTHDFYSSSASGSSGAPPFPATVRSVRSISRVS